MGILCRKAAAEAGGPDEREEYELVSPEFCDACGHEILDEREEYCPFCGETLKKVKKPVRKQAGGGGGAVLLLIIAAAVIWLLIRS